MFRTTTNLEINSPFQERNLSIVNLELTKMEYDPKGETANIARHRFKDGISYEPGTSLRNDPPREVWDYDVRSWLNPANSIHSKLRGTGGTGYYIIATPKYNGIELVQRVMEAHRIKIDDVERVKVGRFTTILLDKSAEELCELNDSGSGGSVNKANLYAWNRSHIREMLRLEKNFVLVDTDPVGYTVYERQLR